MIKIQSTQPTFTNSGNIIINGRGFDSTKYYKLNFINSYNNISVTKTGFITNKSNVTFEKLIFTKPTGLSLDRFYKIQVEEYNTNSTDAILIQVSNIAIIKYITEPSIMPSYKNNTITIQGTSSIKIKQAQITIKAGNINLITTNILYPKNNQILYTLDYLISASGSNAINTATAQITYETIDGYQKQENIPTLTIKSINSYEQVLRDTDEILIINANQFNEVDGTITIAAETQRAELSSYEKEQAYINLSNYMADDDNVIYKKYKDIIVSNSLSYGLWYKLSNNIQYDKNIRHHQIQEYALNADFTKLIYAQCDFDHTYLFDSTKNYCIKFNPKISNFKYTHQESKVETIGGQYPFIFRNNNTNYREFQISGLISRLVDVGHEDSTQRTATPAMGENTPTFTTSLNDANMYEERIYREQFLEWLNNGKYKVFKSPTEGNIIVRLMNVSLTPEDKLGRMLYSFSATAVEVAEYNYDNLQQYDLL